MTDYEVPRVQEEAEIGLIQHAREIGGSALTTINEGIDWFTRKTRIGAYAATAALATGGVAAIEAIDANPASAAQTRVIHKTSKLSSNTVLVGLVKALPFNEYKYAAQNHMAPEPPTSVWSTGYDAEIKTSCQFSLPGTKLATVGFKYLDLLGGEVGYQYCGSAVPLTSVPSTLRWNVTAAENRINKSADRILHSVKFNTKEQVEKISSTPNRTIATFKSSSILANAGPEITRLVLTSKHGRNTVTITEKSHV